MSAAEAKRLWRLPWLRVVAALLGFVAVTVVTALIAHPRTFTGFAPYDDEGYMLIALDSFLDQGHLYDDVFSQYGPFYFEFWAAFFSLSGLSVDHDGGRTATVVAWVLTPLLVGVATYRVSRSALLGLATQVITFSAIASLTNEPMHPGGLICLLLGSILVLSCAVRAGPSPVAMGLLGGAVAALILVKVNVGAFALAAVALACVVSYPALTRWRLLRPVIEVAFVATPLLVMASRLDDAWAREYAVHVAVAAFAIVVALRARGGGNRDREELWWLAGGLGAVGVTVLAAILAAGTSPGGLVEGVITQPLRQAETFSVPLLFADRVYLFDLLALVGAVSYWYLSRDRDRTPTPGLMALVGLFSILIGLEMALSVIGRTILFDSLSFSGYWFGLLAFAWLALIPVPGDESPDTEFARLLLPPLAVLQALHAFPVAGSQVMWSAFLLIPVGALCVGNGARRLAQVLRDESERRAVAATAAVAALALVVVIANTQLRRPLEAARAASDATVELGLPGGEDVRVPPPEAELYRKLTRTIASHCASVVTMPGMNSFYIWAEREPPTGFNTTAWMKLFDDAHQQRVVEAMRSVKGLCLLENQPLVDFWMAGERVPQGALVRYLQRGFEPLGTFGAYRLLRREQGAAGGSSPPGSSPRSTAT